MASAATGASVFKKAPGGDPIPVECLHKDNKPTVYANGTNVKAMNGITRKVAYSTSPNHGKVDFPTEEYQSMLCTAVAMGNVDFFKESLNQLTEKGIISSSGLENAYQNIRCGEAGLTLLMVSVASNNKNRRNMMTTLFKMPIPVNETNYSGETELDVILSLGDIVSPRFVKLWKRKGAKTANELSSI
jgi:hypothetical protein